MYPLSTGHVDCETREMQCFKVPHALRKLSQHNVNNTIQWPRVSEQWSRNTNT